MPTTRLVLLVCATLAAPAALAALDNYTINLRREIGGLDIVANATAGPMATVQVANRSSSRVRCFVDFDGGRLMPVRREAWLEPGSAATVQQEINDPGIQTLNVGIACDLLSPDEPFPGIGSPIIRGSNANAGTGTPGAGTPGTGTPVAPPPSGTSVRSTTNTATRTAVTRNTRNSGTTTVISPNPPPVVPPTEAPRGTPSPPASR